VSLALLTFGTATFVFTMEALAARHPEWETPTFLPPLRWGGLL
jgi:hypothetical protein